MKTASVQKIAGALRVLIWAALVCNLIILYLVPAAVLMDSHDLLGGVREYLSGIFFPGEDDIVMAGIAGSLLDNAGVSKENFLYVSLYISLVNSLLEELFFRGLLFLNLKHRSRRFAYVFSAGAFAAYHVAMMIGWFSPVLWLLVMAGLFVGGLIFNWLNEKQESIYPSWLVHMFANFAINTIGFILLNA